MIRVYQATIYFVVSEQQHMLQVPCEGRTISEAGANAETHVKTVCPTAENIEAVQLQKIGEKAPAIQVAGAGTLPLMAAVARRN